MATVELRKVVPEQNCYRRYKVSEQKLLFGGYDLILEWGRIGTSSRLKVETCRSVEEIRKKREEVLGKRRRHGYVVSVKGIVDGSG
jgi:predicted DNA-binding WGR domain protein